MAFFPNEFLDELKSRVSITDLVGKKVKLTRKGGSYWGCCPFHREKTASFSVNPQKGFYHCFGCGEHGDIVSFEMKTENVTFNEAVEKLAGMAGMQLPESTPEDRRERERRLNILEIIDHACTFFQERLLKEEAAVAYLKRRGITRETAEAFRIGYAPGGNELRDFLLEKKVKIEEMTEAGLVATKEGRYYDYFRERIMFPISNRKGQVIAFGGRIMGAGEPKYLNSPESAVFHKSEVLYAYDKAAKNAFKSQSLIVTEGYMDVIALHQSGIDYAVAPLGTALTEAQIISLWKSVPEPVLCFDGDKAGQNAGLRSASRVLPILKAGYSLKYVWLPDGMDPDDIIKKQGRAAFERLLEGAQPLVDIVWRTISEGNTSTPEKMAGISKKIDEVAGQIQDMDVRKFYAQELRNRLYETSRGQYLPASKRGKPAVKTRAVKIAPGDEDIKTVIAYLICYPDIAISFASQISLLEAGNSKLDGKLQALLDFEERPDFSDDPELAMYVEQVKNRYKRHEFPDEMIKEDIARKLKSFSLLAIDREIKSLQEEIGASEGGLEKMERLKALMQERNAIIEEISG